MLENIRNIGKAFRVVDEIEQYQHMVIERSGPSCNMLLALYNMDERMSTVVVRRMSS